MKEFVELASRERRRRLSSTATLLALLCALFVAAPVLADESSPPDEQQVAEGLEAIEREEAARQQELEEPEAVHQREASAEAYGDLTASESRQLLLSTFPDVFTQLNADPARSLNKLHLVKVFGESMATVKDPEGEGSLLEADIPLRTENEEGDLEKVKLTLVPGEEGFEPENPLTDVQIPTAADEQFAVGDEGLAVKVQGAEAPGQALGEMQVYYPEAQDDTDLLAAPIAGGLELFDQLRSPASPEVLHFHLDLPKGATVTGNASGGATVEREGEAVAMVPPPTAVDAQGTNVPLQLEVEGADLTLHVAHRGGDYAYPILVDPSINENYNSAWYSGNSFASLAPGIWSYKTNDPTETYILHNTYCLAAEPCSPTGRGLFISSLNRNIPANTYGQWLYNVPGSTTFIPSIYPEPSVIINPFYRSNGSCKWENYEQPHDYDGTFDAAGNWTYLETDRAQWAKKAELFTKAKGVAIGLSTVGSSVNIPCWRNIMVGGVAIRLDDPEAPTLGPVTGFPTGWTRSNTRFTVTANVSDPGLGVRNVTVWPTGTTPVSLVPGQSECFGSKVEPCPASRAAQFTLYAENFDEGENQVHVSAWDPTTKFSNTYTTTTKIDRQAPEINLGGQFAQATHETEGEAKDPTKWDELSLPVYNLRIEALDGSAASPEQKRSGVKSIEVFIDGASTPDKTWTQECPASSCKMEQTYELQLVALSPGKHTLKVVAKDQVNQARSREIGFEFVPATGIKDDYVMQHFPLPDGKDHSAEETYGGPELAVNVSDGNLVFREQDVNVEGPNADLEVERVYNSLLPNEDNTEWGDGWTLAQTPELEPVDTGGTPAPDIAKVVGESGDLKDQVGLPAGTGGTQFDPNLQATVTKTASGFEMTDETGGSEETVEFNSAGRAEGIDAPGEASIDFNYEGGAISEMSVEDPTSSMEPPPKPETLEPLSPAPPSYQSAFGSKGSAEGQLSNPADVAVAPEGNVWVVDRGNNRVEKFSPSGTFLSKFGSSGTGNGQFSSPTGIEVDGEGNLWVVDSFHGRVEKFNAKGEYLWKFGTEGIAPGQLSFPQAVALDGKGNAWVTQAESGRVQEFNSKGEFVRVLAPSGTAPGQISEATDVAVAGNGNVWVSDWNNRLEVFSEAGTFIRQFGSAGTGDGQFSHPVSVEVDSAGHVWVLDQGGGRVEEFTEGGKFLAKFGSKGTGSGQLSPGYSGGLATDDEGQLWIADANNNRVQRWQDSTNLVRFFASYQTAVGSKGSAEGQFSNPADVAAAPEGNVWVADRGNNRVEKFSPDGTFLFKFGAAGGVNGYFNSPAGLDVDEEGNLWVVDSGNYRVQKFNSEGQFISKFGAMGTAPGQLFYPQSIAVDGKGNAWVTQAESGRVQEFNSKGEFARVLAPTGTAAGQISEATDVTIGGNGNVWVTDANNRVEVFNEGGTFIRQFGSTGSGDGQFSRPVAIDVDNLGHVWVLDQGNGRVEEFTEGGVFLGKFGSKGTGSGQLSPGYSGGLANDDEGHLWIADTNNNRLARWEAFDYRTPEEVLPPEPANDPAVDIATSNGLVTSVSGKGAGQNTYTYSGDDLVANKGPEGETKFTYDSAGRMTRVELPNGTVATIAYDNTYHRVATLTVDPAGAEPAKTTSFSYVNEPRKTIVTPPDAAIVNYEIAPDGSVFKWWNEVKAGPEVSLAGTLWVHRETEAPMSTGLHNLEIQADAVEGVSSIQIIADGNTIVEERTCNQNPETPEVDCRHEVAEWVTETGSLQPGIMPIEVLAKDRIGNATTKRFWVNVPYTPPPNPEEDPPPTFAEIKAFREAYGLDRDLNPETEQQQINNRIYDLLAAWSNPRTPEGEVARSSEARWGVPLRPVDVAELEFREWYIATDVPLIEAWANEYFPNTYAGIEVDEAHGGMVRIGFTENQVQRVSEFKAAVGPVAANRIEPYSAVPLRSLSAAEILEEQVVSVVNADLQLRTEVTGIGVEGSDNRVTVGSTAIASTEARLAQLLGSLNGISVLYEAPVKLLSGRDREGGRMLSGDRVWTDWKPGEPKAELTYGTAGFPAFEKTWVEAQKKYITTPFLLAAGHMGKTGDFMYRVDHFLSQKSEWESLQGKEKIGRIGRNPYWEGSASIDALAMRFNSDGVAPLEIYGRKDRRPPIGPEEKAYRGEKVCFSGASTGGVRCGTVTGFERVYGEGRSGMGMIMIKAPRPSARPISGDSGGPLWDPRTHASLGVISGNAEHHDRIFYATPLLTTPTGRHGLVVGALNASVMGGGSLHIRGGD